MVNVGSILSFSICVRRSGNNCSEDKDDKDDTDDDDDDNDAATKTGSTWGEYVTEEMKRGGGGCSGSGGGLCVGSGGGFCS